MLQLVVTYPDGRVQRLELDRNDYILGRDPACDVQLPDPKVSRRHARLSRSGTDWTLEDLGSVNGYALDGAVHHGRSPLLLRSRVTIGPFVLHLEGQGHSQGPRREASNGRARPALYRLVVTDGALMGQVVGLSQGEHVVGRAGDTDVVLDDPSISRRHAAVRVTAEGVVEVSDLGSSNGTFVDGEPVQRKTVRAGQSLRFGNVPMRLESLAEAPRAATARRHELSAGSKHAAEAVRASLPPLDGPAPLVLRADDVAEAARQAHAAVNNEAAGAPNARHGGGDDGARGAAGALRRLAGALPRGRGARAATLMGACLVLGLGGKALWGRGGRAPGEAAPPPDAAATDVATAAASDAEGGAGPDAAAAAAGNDGAGRAGELAHGPTQADGERGEDRRPAAGAASAPAPDAPTPAAGDRGRGDASADDGAATKPGLLARLTARLAPAGAEETAWQQALEAALRAAEGQLAEADWDAAAEGFAKALALEPASVRGRTGRRLALRAQAGDNALRGSAKELAANRPFEALVAASTGLVQLGPPDATERAKAPAAAKAAVATLRAALLRAAEAASAQAALQCGSRAQAACVGEGYASCVDEADCAMAFAPQEALGPASLAWTADVLAAPVPRLPAGPGGDAAAATGGQDGQDGDAAAAAGGSNDADDADAAGVPARLPDAAATLAALTQRYPQAPIRRALLIYGAGNLAAARKALANIGSRQAQALQLDVAAVIDLLGQAGKAEQAGNTAAALGLYQQALTVDKRLMPPQAACVPRQELAHRAQRILLRQGEQAKTRDGFAAARTQWQRALALDASFLPIRHALGALHQEARALLARAEADKGKGDDAAAIEARCATLRQVLTMTDADDPLHARADAAHTACQREVKRKQR